LAESNFRQELARMGRDYSRQIQFLGRLDLAFGPFAGAIKAGKAVLPELRGSPFGFVLAPLDFDLDRVFPEQRIESVDADRFFDALRISRRGKARSLNEIF